MLTSSWRFSLRCRLGMAMVPSPSIRPASHAASVTSSVLPGLDCVISNTDPYSTAQHPPFLDTLPGNSVCAGSSSTLPTIRVGRASIGGGGGTVIPYLSKWPGLCLHPQRKQVGAGRIIRCKHRILVLARLKARRVYESLQGSPAVGPLATPRRCHTC